MSTDLELPGLIVEPAGPSVIEPLRAALDRAIATAREVLEAVHKEDCLDNLDGFEDALESMHTFNDCVWTCAHEAEQYESSLRVAEDDGDFRGQMRFRPAAKVLRRLEAAFDACDKALTALQRAEIGEMCKLRRGLWHEHRSRHRSLRRRPRRWLRAESSSR